jgi:hypothetical protein
LPLPPFPPFEVAEEASAVASQSTDRTDPDPLQYLDYAPRLAKAIKRLADAAFCHTDDADARLRAAVEHYRKARDWMDFGEYDKWCARWARRIKEVRRANHDDFVWRPSPDRCTDWWLRWSPATYALACVCHQLVDPALAPEEGGEDVRNNLTEALLYYNGNWLRRHVERELISFAKAAGERIPARRELPEELGGLSPALRKLLLFVLEDPGGIEVRQLSRKMEHTTLEHTHVQINRLRTKCKALLRGAPRKLVLMTEAGRVTAAWRPRKI